MQQSKDHPDQSNLTLTANPAATVKVGANQDPEMILVTPNPETSLDLEANRDPDRLLGTMKMIHNRDGVNQNLLHLGANLLNQRAQEVNLALDLVHLMAKAAAVVTKATKHKLNHSMPRNDSKNLPHRPRRPSPQTFA